MKVRPGVAAIMVAAAGQEAARTPWGHPNLQGTYANKTITPPQRPVELRRAGAAEPLKRWRTSRKPLSPWWARNVRL